MKTLEDKFKNQSLDSSKNSFKKYNIAVVSENSLEIYLIKKYLPKEEGYRVLEASSLKELLKITNYLRIDLIIIDDAVSDNTGIKIAAKLLSYEPLKNCSIMLLLSRNYNNNELNIESKKIEYIKKPIDEALFRHRAMLLIDKANGNIQRRSYFSDLALKRFDEIKEYFTIYQNIFLNDPNMMVIYDKTKGSFVEANSHFESFFGNIRLFNRLFFNEKLLSQSVQKLEESNYLNYYESSKWIEMVTQNSSFHYSIKVNRSYEEYSFNIISSKLDSNIGELYLIKLINIYDYLPKNNSIAKDANLKLKEQNLSSFKDEFLELREMVLQKNSTSNDEISSIFSRLSSKLSIICDEPSIVEDFSNISDDLYITTLNTLKNIKNKSISINQKELNSTEHNNESKIYTDKSMNLIEKLIQEIVALQIIGNDLEVLLYQSSDMIIYEFALLGDIDKPNQTIKELTKKLDASIEFIEEEGKSIVVVNIPK